MDPKGNLVVILQKQTGHDISKAPKAQRRLRTECEAAKRALSNTEETTVSVEAIYGGDDLFIKVHACLSLSTQINIPLCLPVVKFSTGIW